MFWIMVAAIAVVGLALAWWLSGRAKPGVPPGRRGSTIEDDHAARSAGARGTKNII